MSVHEFWCPKCRSAYKRFPTDMWPAIIEHHRKTCEPAPEPESCQYVQPGYGSEPPGHCDQDPDEGSDYCPFHGPHAGPDPDAAYDERFL